MKVEGRTENGDPRDVICEMVKALGADLLVMGSHGYGPITRCAVSSASIVLHDCDLCFPWVQMSRKDQYRQNPNMGF